MISTFTSTYLPPSQPNWKEENQREDQLEDDIPIDLATYDNSMGKKIRKLINPISSDRISETADNFLANI